MAEVNLAVVVAYLATIMANWVAWLVIKPRLLQEGDPEPNKGLLAKLEPQFEPPISLALVEEYLRLSALPSFFYLVFHLIFCLVGAEDHVTDSFALPSDLFTQISFLCGILMHCMMRFVYAKYYGGAHRAKVVEGLGLLGNETILNVKCGKGFWLNGIAKVMTAGGRAFGVDTWDADDTPFDGQWASENARREEVSTRIEVMNYGDPHYLTYKDEVFDVTVSSWIESGDEVNYFNAISEMVRVVRPGGRLLFIFRLPTPSNLTQKNLQDLGLTDIHSNVIRTGYLFDRVLTATKPEEYDNRHAVKIDRNENAVTDNSPGFDSSSGECMLYFLTTVGFYVVLAYTTLIYLDWDSLELPSSVDHTDSMAYGLMAENSVWFCWAVIEVHLELSARPVYMVRRVGIFQLWFGYWLQFFVMVMTFNTLTWLPVMLLSLTTGFSSVAFRTFFRIIARPIIGSTLDSFFDKKRQLLFLKYYKEDYGSPDNRYRKPKKKKKNRVKTTDALLGDLHDDI